MTAAVVSIRLAASDLARLMADSPFGIRLTLAQDHFVVRRKIALFQARARVYPEVAGSRLRFVIPFEDLSVDRGVGGLLRGALQIIWRALETRLDRFVAKALADRGLPWEMVWVDNIEDTRGRAITVNVSLTVLNQYLLDRGVTHGLTMRIEALDVSPAALELALDLTPAP